MNLNELIVGQPAQLLTSEASQRSFMISLRRDEKYEVVDLDTDNDYAINVSAVNSLVGKGLEAVESLDVLIYLKNLTDELYVKLAKIITDISEVYPSPDYVVGEIKNLPITDLLLLVQSDEPEMKFKELISG